jgi:hypothetical protein
MAFFFCFAPTLQRLQQFLYDYTVYKKDHGALGHETNFEFQYIPTPDMLGTEMGKIEKGPSNIERRNLKVLVAACAVMGGVAWLGAKRASVLLQKYPGLKRLI